MEAADRDRKKYEYDGNQFLPRQLPACERTITTRIGDCRKQAREVQRYGKATTPKCNGRERPPLYRSFSRFAHDAAYRSHAAKK